MALPAVEDIAKLAIAQQRSSSSYPKPAEMRAAMVGVRKRIVAARAAITKCDEWTKNRIALAYQPHSAASAVGLVEAELAKIEVAIDAASAALDTIVTPQPAAANRARYVASQLRHAFKVFGIRFDRTKAARPKKRFQSFLVS